MEIKWNGKLNSGPNLLDNDLAIWVLSSDIDHNITDDDDNDKDNNDDTINGNNTDNYCLLQ